ncbi:MAG: hypothetical protein HQK76_01685 [Desulfobacterales bacterium]|nr:hypothetical protein [Desulfobacterales bacterium]
MAKKATTKKKNTQAKGKTTKQSNINQSTSSKSADTKNISLGSLILKKFNFGSIKPIKITKKSNDAYSSPAFFDANDKKELKTLHGILFRSFDIKKFSSRKILSFKEILLHKFEGFESPKPQKIEKQKEKNYTAPDFSTELIKKLLFQKFDIASFPSRKFLTFEEILFQKFEGFESPKPQKIEKQKEKNYTAPGFSNAPVKLLFQKFDIASFPSRKFLTFEEILFQKFEGFTINASEKVHGQTKGIYSSPSFAVSEKEMAILFRTFDLSKVEEKKSIPIKEEKKIEASQPVQEESKVEDVKKDIPKAQEAEPEVESKIEEQTLAKAENTASTEIETTPKRIIDYSFPQENKRRKINPKKIYLNFAAGVFAFFVLLITITSISNHSKYYIQPVNNGIKIYRGVFAPLGEEKFMCIYNVKAPIVIKSFYTKKEIFPIILNYCLDDADSLITVKGIPDFEAYKMALEKSCKFALTPDTKRKVQIRFNSVDFAILLNKADIVMLKKTPENLNLALEYLNQAASLEPDKLQAELVEKKMMNIITDKKYIESLNIK